MDQVPLTKEGFVRLEGELKNLKSVQRPAVIQAIAEARAHGDLSENAEYHAAREQQSFIEGRIQELESVIGRAQVIDPKTMTGQVVKFGATVTVVDEDSDDEETYQLVGEYESDTEKGKLSIGAPVARALIGKSVGDLVKVKTPKGLRSYEILDVKYK
ncbi:MAG: transcription elongation factor GreA [Alphaproteobacteria bacterium]|jgi:transcription elongation factor GreA|nr:transcription elongation factor GreA [Alphaproteobacteria bacterium]MBK9587018.1 transcription elongation factor GreA [Alphaproteobacteria bacterium]MBP7758787.1 transcription elongation factor GreA [Alphaproteobacteria bacterium]MBP7762139.1 transcription elongation factor GreA [Alphaproteobacteria bacterium]MBP7904152.1 transcription elongation factor GreA [Alphaproteobacteria bacterium]